MDKRKKGRSLVAVLLICVMVCTLTACASSLSGTYTSKEGLIEQSFTFKDDNKVEVSAFGIDVEGEYLIEDGEITITYSLLGIKYDWVKSFEKDGSSIFIDGVEFVKEK
jgi:hypothetical protein